MSLLSGQTNISSILKSPARLTPLVVNKVRFHLPLCNELEKIFNQYIKRDNVREYQELVCYIRDTELQDTDLELLLTNCVNCVPLLGQDVKLFVEAFLSIKWAARNRSIVSKYQMFLLDLLTYHNHHVPVAMEKLVLYFKEEVDWPGGNPTPTTLQKMTSVHNSLEKILQIIPMSCEIFLRAIIDAYPYYQKTKNVQISYIHNLLLILNYRPEFRKDIMMLIINRLIILDANAPKNDIEDAENADTEDNQFVMDSDECSMDTSMKHPIASALDMCMLKLFEYIKGICFVNGEVVYNNVEMLYKDIIVVFERIILPTHAIQHVQFIMFYICSMKVIFVEAFLSLLWKKVTDPTAAPVHRQVAVCYIASLLARGKFIPMSMLRAMLSELSGWLHNYISSQDCVASTNNCLSTSIVNPNGGVIAHRVFYTVAQALFYVIAFRHKDLSTGKRNLAFLQALNLTKLVTCALNPLRYCLPIIVQNFAAVTRAEQLAYCYTIMERNERNNITTLYSDNILINDNTSLDTFFPFDPYCLKRSLEYIDPIYLQYESCLASHKPRSQAKSISSHDEDDFLENASSLPIEISDDRRSRKEQFTYDASPGFKY